MSGEPLTKVDSAVQGLEATSPPKEGHIHKHRRASSSANGVMNINDLETQGIDLQIAKETQMLGWKVNTSPTSIDDKEYLKVMLTTPPVKKIDLYFKTGLHVTARNLKGVTIRDAMDAIHKSFKKKPDDELPEPYLRGFEWDKEESWTSLIVHLATNPGTMKPAGGSSKKKKKAAAAEEEAA
ncbi:hypothetical protein SMACR_00711 [Sordaria macrospora]|uniref:WGS project CABT00000000 data, contig 2.2 n=2 Tax=Sordaria macrospora TaxID=5147 RepID=F7VMV6_SORMK|nr:uncharacterized protein SMAC_00711 [Sordaria macrospora k-hell]KAA8633937.1 hypothetical protein SMACR_00711 [Sordaria macrospora]KAH7630155.1 hypothetical protein B0T09DRAFT_142956 [Sordaria sp. MPI-SDFR-AT-0083]WPJ66830.1 hypothetical protein SMAC4_00711 [Sordaria macrospora]CCC06685.1 unnamed protein product [Sordaria macrospora k-hell]